MQIIRLIIILQFYSVVFFAQDSAVIKLQEWQNNYLIAENIYSKLSENTELYEKSQVYEDDSVLNFYLNQSLDKIVQSLQNTKDVIAFSGYYSTDAQYAMFESCLLGLWFNQIDVAKKVYPDSLAIAFLDICTTLRTDVNSLSFYDLNYLGVSKDNFYQSYYDMLFIQFLHALKKNDNLVAYKTGDEYLTNLLLNFDRDFPSIIFYEPQYSYEQRRVYRILIELTSLCDKVNKRMVYNLLQLEYLANFYSYERQNDSSFSLNDSELEMIKSCEEIIDNNYNEFKKIEESELRLADVYFLLGNSRLGLKYYSQAIIKQETSTSDLKKFIDFTIPLTDSLSDTEFIDECKKYVDDAAGFIFQKEKPIQELEELQYLVNCFKFSGNIEKVERINAKLNAIEEEKIAREKIISKRSKTGFRLGFSPIKLALVNKYHNYSVFGDVKIKGFEQGFRYCRYNGIEDHYRFGAWMYSGDDERAFNKYSGDEFSYWITLHNIDEFDTEQKFCLELRYGRYRFDPIVTNIINRETEYFQFYNYSVNAIAHRYDLSIVYRYSIFAGDIFFFETNISMGLGFRYITSEFNNQYFLIDDYRYSDDLWPMLTVPLRMGFRTGIRFL